MSVKHIRKGGIKYTMGRLLGAGGYGKVYEARDPQGETWAIKIVRVADRYLRGPVSEFEDYLEEIVGEFGMIRARAEERGLRWLPNLAYTKEVLVVDGGKEVWFVMEKYVSDATMIRLRFPADNPRFEGFIIDVASALAELKESGLVHRDIKPQNMLLGQDGKLYLSDFGTMCDLRSVAEPCDAFATPGFAEPDMYKKNRATYASDAYAAGAALAQIAIGGYHVGSQQLKQLMRLTTAANGWIQNPYGQGAATTRAYTRLMNDIHRKLKATLPAGLDPALWTLVMNMMGLDTSNPKMTPEDIMRVLNKPRVYFFA